MKLLCASIGFLAVLLTFAPSAIANPHNSLEVVRVRLKQNEIDYVITGRNLRFQTVSNPYQAVAVPSGSLSRLEVRSLHKDDKTLWSVRLNTNETAHLFSQQYLLVRGESLKLGSQSLPDKILFAHNGKKIDLVGVLPLEDYVTGVIASEMPLSWPMETLKAQAVAARSYALAVIKERRNRDYHLESSVLDQVFKQVVDHDSTDPNIKKAIVAVKSTAGVQLLSPKGHTLKAFYHADCGGQTTAPKNVWNFGVNTGTVVDDSCPTSPRAQWTLKISTEELRAKLRTKKTDAAISNLQLVRATPHDRVSQVQIVFEGGQRLVMDANEFRQVLGFQDLKSAQFEVTKERDSFLFKGRGFGHGVGLCQWGSRALGLRGLSYLQILKHYYPLAQLKSFEPQKINVAQNESAR